MGLNQIDYPSVVYCTVSGVRVRSVGVGDKSKTDNVSDKQSSQSLNEALKS